MENNQPKKKSAGLTALIALLLIITTVASCFGIYAWAKYISSENGQATAQIAKWNFNVSLKAGDNTVTLGEQNIDLVTTEYNHVASHRIAPGTAGEFDIIIDTTGTEVDLQYDVTLTLENCPRNITFSKKGPGEEKATEISVGGASQTSLSRTLTFSKYVTHGQNGTFTEKIYWNWPYELTTGTDAEKTAWDGRDNEDQGKTVTMDITVTGTEMLKNPNNTVQTLAQNGQIQQWDSINYDPGDGSISDSDLTLAGASLIGDTKVASINGATLKGTINASSASDWVVLDVNQTTGEVKIIPRTYSNTLLQLSGKDGYNNAIEAINQVAEIYENTEFAEEGKTRSLTVEDVNKVEDYTPSGSALEYTWNAMAYSMDDNLNIVNNGTHKVQVKVGEQEVATGQYEDIYEEQDVYNDGTFKSSAENPYYDYNLSKFIKKTGNNNQSCWLASRCVSLDSGGCSFNVRLLYNGGVNSNNYLFYVRSDGYAGDRNGGCPVVPVVTLKSTVKMEKDSNSVWQLSL